MLVTKETSTSRQPRMDCFLGSAAVTATAAAVTTTAAVASAVTPVAT